MYQLEIVSEYCNMITAKRNLKTKRNCRYASTVRSLVLIRCVSCCNVYKLWILLTEVYWCVLYESKGRPTPKFRKILNYRQIDMEWHTRRTESSARSANGDCLPKKVNWLVLKVETELFLCEAGTGFFFKKFGLKRVNCIYILTNTKKSQKSSSQGGRDYII